MNPVVGLLVEFIVAHQRGTTRRYGSGTASRSASASIFVNERPSIEQRLNLGGGARLLHVSLTIDESDHHVEVRQHTTSELGIATD
jgi:hypothetical protein